MEQLIDLDENSCLRDVSNKDYYLRKKRERDYKQIEVKLETERPKRAYANNVGSFVCMHHATSANKFQQLPTLLGLTML